MGVVSWSSSPTCSLMKPPFFSFSFMTASTAYVFMFRLRLKFLSLICLSLWSGRLLVCSISSILSVPCFFLSLMTSTSCSPVPSLPMMSTMETPMNSLPSASSSQDYRKILSLSAVPILNSSFQTGVLPPSWATLVLQLLSAYLTTTKGSIFVSVSRSQLQLACTMRIFIAGFLFFFSIFFNEHSSTPTLFFPSSTSILQLGISGLAGSNLSTPVPIIFQFAQTSIIISGSLLRQKQISQLQRCLSAGMKYVFMVFSNLPTFILKTGVSSKLPAFRHSLYISFFFITSIQIIQPLPIPFLTHSNPMKKKTDFLEQMKNSQQFLNKLNNFKKASKQIKDKNKLVSHRNIWVKEYKYLARLQRDQDLESVGYFEVFDKYFGFQVQERQVFGKDQEKSYGELLRKCEESTELYQANIWKQLKSLPLLINRLKQPKTPKSPTIDLQSAAGILTDLSTSLSSQQQALNNELNELQKFQINLSRVEVLNSEGQEEESENQFSFLQDLLVQHNFDDVRGFDFQSNQLRRIQEGEKYLKEYIESLSDRLSQDEISGVINEYHHASDLLNQTLELELEKITLDYEQALSLDSNLLSMSQNYQIINHIYNTYLGRGKSVSLYSERLAIEFPNVSKKILERMTEYIEGKIYKNRKSNACKRNFLREKQELLQKVEKEVNDRIGSKIRKAQKEAERLQRKEEKIKLEKELEQLRAQYEQRKAEKDKIVHEEEEKQRQEERKRDAVRKLYLDELNKKAAEVHEIKEKTRKEEEERKKAEKLEQERNAKKQIQQNRPKVQQRQSNQVSKIQKKLQQQKQRREQPIKNQQRINKAIETYSFRPNPEPSEQRLLAPTEALIKHRETTYDKADKIELTKMTGYNINQLMGDRRFRLNAALFQAGLANTEYAREVLNMMSKKPNN